MKRVLLFIVTNLAVMLVLGIAARILGVDRFLTANGLNMGALLGFALIMGFGGATISLLMSKPMAKWSTGAQVINDSPDPTHRWIVGAVQRFSEKAGIQMPEVAIYEGEPNAFATGAFKNSALVAVSTGLLHSMNFWIANCLRATASDCPGMSKWRGCACAAQEAIPTRQASMSERAHRPGRNCDIGIPRSVRLRRSLSVFGR